VCQNEQQFGTVDMEIIFKTNVFKIFLINIEIQFCKKRRKILKLVEYIMFKGGEI